MDVKFSELASAGFRTLFPEEWRRVSVIKHVALLLRSDPTRSARACAAPGLERFWIRGFYAAVEIRVLFEVGDDVTVWNVAPASTLTPLTK